MILSICSFRLRSIHIPTQGSLRFLQLTFIVLLLSAQSLSAQKSGHEVSPKFSFTDGVYMSFEEFQRNAPSGTLPKDDQLATTLNENQLYLNADLNKTVASKPWGLSYKGKPYIYVHRENTDVSNMFVKLHVVGNLCYFYYEGYEDHKVSMNVYNPMTMEILATKEITNHDKVFYTKMLRFESGETATFDFETFKVWTASDTKLAEALASMPADNREEKLFKTLLIYNDRHPVYFKNSTD